MSSHATGTITMQLTVRLLTSTTWSAGGIILGTTAGITQTASQTLAPWTLDLDIVLRTLSIGGASTVATMGLWSSPLGFATPFAATLPANNTAVTLTTVDNSATYYLFLSATAGASQSDNLIQTELLKLYGEN